jgi:hypothetical protein
MSRYGVLAVGPSEVWLFSWRESFDPAMAALFADNESSDQYIYRSSAATIRSRLDLLGYDSVRSRTIIEDKWPTRTNSVVELEDVSPHELISDFAEHLWDPPEQYELHNPSAERFQEQVGHVWGQDEHMLKYLVDRLPDEAPVVLDLGQLDDGRYFTPSATFCRDVRAEERGRAVGSLPTIVLVEGPSDAEFLRAALEIRRPELVDFLTFMDYGSKPGGGVANVVQGLRSLAAAGVGNRVVAVLDNDAAGLDGLRQLATAPLPANMRATTLPDVPLHASYPALGPDGLAMTNVSGRAAALELYLGADVLATLEGFEPVQWTSYLKPVSRYQGELQEKAEVQKRYREKVTRARAGGPVNASDWRELDAVLERIIATAKA